MEYKGQSNIISNMENIVMEVNEVANETTMNHVKIDFALTRYLYIKQDVLASLCMSILDKNTETNCVLDMRIVLFRI